MKNITSVAIALSALVLSTAVYYSLSGPQEAEISAEVIAKFNQWSLSQNRLYSTPSEQSQRLLNFKNNLDQIEQINSSQEHYKAGLNRFSDLSKEEFVAKFTVKNRVSNVKKMNLLEETSENLSQQTLPEAYDLRSVVPAGKKPIVKNQLSCGSCYSFAATSVIEYAQALSKNPQNQYTGPLAPQEFVDCSAVSSESLFWLIGLGWKQRM